LRSAVIASLLALSLAGSAPASANGAWKPGLFAQQRMQVLKGTTKPLRLMKRLGMKVERAGDKVAEHIATFGGSRAYMVGLATALVGWALGNTVGGLHIDPEPFVLANLGVSVLTNVQGFFVLKSQEHQREKDRKMRDLAFDHLDDGVDHVSGGLRLRGVSINSDGRASAFKPSAKLNFEDKVAKFSASWKFFGSYVALTAGWLTLNTLAPGHHMDPSPFLGLNTVNTLFAVYQALFILRSQDRMDREDRSHLEARIGHLEHKLAEQGDALRGGKTIILPANDTEAVATKN
jgi:uncharacterized membrane protein